MNRKLVLVISLVSMLVPGTTGDQRTVPATVSSEATVNVVAPGGPAERVLGLYNDFMNGAGRGFAWRPGAPLSEGQLALMKTLMTTLYAAAAADGADAHKTIALLISQGLSDSSVSDAFQKTFQEKGHRHWQIGDEMSLAMAEARDVLIEQSVVEVARKNGWMIGRSDSGNPKSGMRSDLDQTFFVFRIDSKTGAKIRDESLDARFIREFEQAWAAANGRLGLKMLDVVSIAGKNRFPDPRSTSSRVEFTHVYHSTLAELRNLPGAYTTYGAVMQQVQRRMMETLDALRNPEKAGLWREKGRIWQEYGPVGNGQGAYGKNQKPDYELAARTMFFAPADLLADSALGAAVANHLELQHYLHKPKFNTKYHLRTFDDALYSAYLGETGRGLKDKVDYSDMGVERRRAAGAEILNRIFPGDPVKQSQHLLALEISCDLRLEHTAEKPADLMRVEAYKRHGDVPSDPDMRKQLIYEQLARALEGDKFRPDDESAAGRARTRNQIKCAEQHYRRLASELGLEAINKTAGDALAFFTDPARADRLIERTRALLEKTAPSGVDWEATKQNIAESARITLLYAIHDLGALGGAMLLHRIGGESGAKYSDLFKVYLKGQLIPIAAFRANPDAYLRTWKKDAGALAERVYLHSLAELGFTEPGKAHFTLDFIRAQKLAWSPVAFAHKWADSAFWDSGSILSLGQVAKTYFLSKGDVDAVMQTAGMEVLGAMPLVGQVATVLSGDAEGLAKMVVSLASPTGRAVVFVYDAGQVAYSIYEVEVGQPARDNVVDALYRGFAGPESVAYGEPGKPPPTWTADDEQALGSLRQQLSRAAPPPGQNPEMMNVVDRHRYFEERARQEARYDEVRRDLEPKIGALQLKQRDFEQYANGAWAGGEMTGIGAVPGQLWLTTSILDAVTPVVGFMTSGVVDLRTPYVPARDEARLAELRAAVQPGRDVEQRLQAAADLHELEILKERWERSQRYERHAREKRPELLSRLKRDSVFRFIQENRINMDEYVDRFVAEHGEKLAKELEKHGLLYPTTVMPPRVHGEPMGDPKRLYSIAAFADALKQRLKDDYERSRQLLAAYLRLEQERTKLAAENVARGRTMFQNETLGLAVAALEGDESHGRFLTALRASAIQRAAPSVEVTFHKVSRNPRSLREGASGQPLPEIEPAEIRVTADIVADETIYHPPYTAKAAFLGGDEVERPEDCTGGIPLWDGTRQAIASLAARHREDLAKGRGVIGIASVLAAGISDLSGAIPATLALLPPRDRRGPGGEVVLGQQVAFIPVGKLEVRADPIRVAVMDQGGRMIVGKEGLVTIGGAPATISNTEYWGSHRFTKFGESIEILAAHAMPDGREIKASKPLSIDDLPNWLEPQSPQPIVLQLPLFLPGSFTLTGKVVAPGAARLTRCRAKNAALGIDEDLLGAAGDGIFRIPLEAVVAADGTVELVFEAASEGATYTARASRPVPERAGVIDFGTVTLEGSTGLVVVPGWDDQNPPALKDYAALLRPLGLKAEPIIGPLAPKRGFDHRVSDTSPSPGSRVARESSVAVVLFGRYARTMPDLRGWPLARAVRQLEALDLVPTSTVGPAPDRAEQQHTVAEQSKGPGVPVDPGTEVALVVYGRFAPSEPRRAADPPAPPRPPRRPYYAVFSVTIPELGAASRSRMPKQGDDEPKEAYRARRSAFVSALADSEFGWKDLPETETVLVVHVSQAALERYPPEFFKPDGRYACALSAGGKLDDGRDLTLHGAFLVTFRRFFDRLDDVTAAYPNVKKQQKELQAIAFTTADGRTEVTQTTGGARSTSTWGPITAGWTEQDRKGAIALVKMIMQLFDCFVATTVYGDASAPEVLTLRAFRDRVLLRSESGRRFAALYDRSGPRWARFVSARPALLRGTRAALDAGTWLLDRLDPDDPWLGHAADFAARLGVALLEGSDAAEADDWCRLARDHAARCVREGRSP
jgi:hypothetical protein